MDIKKIKILFFGTSEIAKEILEALVRNEYNISAVITQTDKKTGREQTLKPSPVKEFSEINKISVFQPRKLDEEAIKKIKKIDPDLIVVIAYGKIIPKEILEIPKYKSINIHPSMLPKFRGPSPIQNAILAGEKETGITVMLMDEKMDHGDILNQTKVLIYPNETTETLSQKIAPVSSRLLLETIPLWITKKIKPRKQDDAKATYCQLIEREDGHVFWDSEAQEIFNKFRALDPWPGIFSVWKNGDNACRIKLTKISLQENNLASKHALGEVFKMDKRIGVEASKGIIFIEEIQLEGKKPVAIREFINGHKNFVGSILK
jgi:methionyl-tRNA formyltransferase